jgi:hypothetical protein
MAWPAGEGLRGPGWASPHARGCRVAELGGWSTRVKLRSVTATVPVGGLGVDRRVDRRPWKSQSHVCFHSRSHEASLLVKYVLRTSVLLLIRWFRVRPPSAPPAVLECLPVVPWTGSWTDVGAAMCPAAILSLPRSGKSGMLGDRVIHHPGAALVTESRPDIYPATAGTAPGLAPSRCSTSNTSPASPPPSGGA